MDASELAKSFVGLPTAEVLEKIKELVRENPSAAVAIVGMLGMAYIAKLGIDATKK